MKITIPYNRVHDKKDGKYVAALATRYQDAFLLGVVAQPDLRKDDTLCVQVIKPDRITVEEILSIAQVGGEVEGARVYAKVVGSELSPYLDADELPLTWAAWLTAQYPHIKEADPGDGYLYFGCHPKGRAIPATELLKLQQAGVTLMKAAEYTTATTQES